MMVLEMVPYNPDEHEPRTGWDAFSIDEARKTGKALLVDQNGEVWTSCRREYVGKVEN